MAFVCAISGEVPEVPVISPKSGAVFERRLLEKHLNSEDTDPVNGETLTIDEVIDVKVPTTVRPRPPSATSIPALLKLFQDEWDAVVLESYELRKHVETIRQELSHALYQHDAACRVIARLTKERDQARNALSSMQPGATAGAAAPDAMDTDAPAAASGEEPALTADVIKTFKKNAKALSKVRADKPIPKELAKQEEIRGYSVQASHTAMHSANNGGLTCLDLHPTSQLVLTGGQDKTTVLFDGAAENVVATYKGHTKPVTDCLFHPTEAIVVTSSNDKTVRIWDMEKGRSKHILKCHKKPVTGISIHPMGEYMVSVSEDTHWAFSNLKTGKTLVEVADPDSEELSCTTFHPDGLLFATGNGNSIVRVWDIRKQNNVATFQGHTGQIKCVAFSENGFYLATAAEEQTVRLWDLRKLTNFKCITLDDNYEFGSLDFDLTGSYLGVGGTDLRVYETTDWNLLNTFSEHTEKVVGVKFGHHAKTLYSASLDRSLKVFS